MAAIAEGLVLGVLAAAEVNCFGLGGFVFYGRDVGGLVAAVAEGLVGAQSACAPVIGFFGFDFDWIWALLRNLWF